MPDTYVIVIHGIGNQQVGFSNFLYREINRGKDEIIPPHCWREVAWQCAINEPYNRIFRTIQRIGGPFSRFLRRVFISLLADAIFYSRPHYNPKIKEEFYKVISKIPNESEVIFVAHSLGTVMLADCLAEIRDNKMSDYIKENYEIKDFKIKKIITFGSPESIFSVGTSGVNGKKKGFDAELGWDNLVAKLDLIAWPLKDFYEGVNDIIVRNEWKNHIYLHSGYWYTKRLKKMIKEAYLANTDT